jgi:ubiquitin-protein ligase
MDRQRVLKEAQQIASKYSFWMVSGNISHLYGYIHKTNDRKYELEIKFPEQFPQIPPHLIYDDDILNLLSEPNLEGIEQWSPESSVLSVLDELYIKIQNKLNPPIHMEDKNEGEIEEYITPDLNKYPPEEEIESSTFTPTGDELFYNEPTGPSESPTQPQSHPQPQPQPQDYGEHEFIIPENAVTSPEELFIDTDSESLEGTTELAFIQQEYAYDEKGDKPAHIIVYLTITLTRTFLIDIDFSNYPQKPNIIFPNEVKAIIGDPYTNLQTLTSWDNTKNPHIIDILHELETKLFSLKTVEEQLRKISQEFQFEPDPSSLTRIKVHLLTYGFDEYVIHIDLEPYPNPPSIDISAELREILNRPVKELSSIQNWVPKESEPIDVIRELAWLVDKNSRINFELELLKEHYQNISYDALTDTLRVDMKGKMKTEDLTFEFKIELPRDYPMSIPKVSVINEFDLETHEKSKEDLHASFDDFFDEWTPYSYLVDLFNLISKKIFEVSVVACVICHQIDCPTCSLKIAGSDEDACHIACPSCDRVYHKHCWDQTIKSFGKCGFCLKVPPPEMIP